MDVQESPIESSGTSVITVRLPRAMHDELKDEAHDHRTTLNKLCVSKLAQQIDPTDVLKSSQSAQHAVTSMRQYRSGPPLAGS